jgi:putative addiction module component (TIGR02574 family)
MELPEEARAALADSLLDSLEAEIDPDAEQPWCEEIERHLAALNDGSIQLLPWDEVQARLRARI